ncbi:uncharacterized protein B0I36DRAFT_350624 [Microdochium trichocladiopsis]|uniref:F-box domain-containing protein n=1 Tax=Microdochium trichocladiopsis TaxID=1682393 RepID=A0A9P9BQ02_9PEZI|nr:uncharacterized protein B0I36DRAFT_350624 [Microdochium trichocladiopsis]KAH7029814.1 hypothetical protein B0I36DRAFT_350624 [Microdochium trichocladiopsis]
MEILPQEVLDAIMSCLHDDKPARVALATVSRRWQSTIEKSAFRKIKLETTDFHEFRQIIHNNQRRRRYLHVLRLNIVLPPYSDDERRLFEDETDRRANNAAFSAVIHDLFGMLQHWQVATDADPNPHFLTLELADMYSTSDHPFLHHWSEARIIGLRDKVLRAADGKLPPDAAERPRHYFHRGRRPDPIVDLYKCRHRYSYVELLDAEKLPSVPIIGTFGKSMFSRNLGDHVMLRMAARMPNLVTVSWRLNMWNIKYLSIWRQQRALFTRAVEEVVPGLEKLERLLLWMGDPLPWAANFAWGSLNPISTDDDHDEDCEPTTAVEYDLLSSALRRTLSRLPALKSVDLGGMFDASLFLPPRLWRGGQLQRHGGDGDLLGGMEASRSIPGDSVRCWPSLEIFGVRFEARKPAGGLYFVTGTNSDDESTRRRLVEAGWALSTEDEEPPGYHQEIANRPPQVADFGDDSRQNHSPKAIRDAETAAFTTRGQDYVDPSHDAGPVLADQDGSLTLCLAAFARACASSMPKLQQADLYSCIPGSATSEDGTKTLHARRAWGVQWLQAGRRSQRRHEGWYRDPDLAEDVGRRRLLWDTQDWRPTDELRRLFAEIGDSKYSDRLLEKCVSTEGANAYERLSKRET